MAEETSLPRFSVLGPVELVGPDGTRTAPGGRKARMLLALLLLNRHRSLSAGALVEELWGDSAPGAAEVTLRSHVSNLRRWLAGSGYDDLLTTGPSGYRLAPPAGQVDVEQFEELVGSGQEALGLGRPDQAAIAALEALALWRDQPFPELPEVETAGVEVGRLEELRLVALEVRGTAQLQSDQHREAVAGLEALVAEHPFRERFCGQLMLALYRCGRQADALAAYASLRERLADELGLDPGPELQELSHQILRQDPDLLGETPTLPARPASAPAEPVAVPLPDALLAASSRAPLVGRTREQQRLDAAWRDVAGGGSRLVVLSGEPGIGKTRLVAKLAADAAAAGRPVLVGRCEGTALAYRPVTDALRSTEQVGAAVARLPEGLRGVLDRFVQDPGTAAGSAELGDRTSAHTAVTVLLRELATSGPVVLVVEDAEQVDRASALLLGHLAERLPPGVLVVLCFRDPPGATHEPLGELLAALPGGDLVDRIVLGPLAESEVVELLGQVAADLPHRTIRTVWERTGGNPFFAVEIARNAGTGDGGAAVPAAVRDALRQRLETLGDPTREALTAAAVLGGSVEFGLLARVLQVDEDDVAAALDDAVAAGFLVESGRAWAGGYSFPHALVREAIRGEVPGHRLRRWHARCARELIATTTLGGTGSSEVALHLRGAGSSADPDETVAWCLAAATESEGLAAWDEALEHAEAAVELLTVTGPGTRLAGVCVQTADLRLRSTRGFARAVNLLETALREYAAAGETGSAAVVHSRLGSALALHHSVMDVPRALEHLDAADRLGTDPRHAFHVLRGRAQAAMFGLRTEVLAEAAEQAHRIAEDSTRPDFAVLAGWAQGWAAFNAGQVATGFAMFERSWSTAHELAVPTIAWGTVNAAALIANTYLLDPALARTWCRRGMGHPRFTSLEYGNDTAADQLALALGAQGDLAAAHRAAESLSPDATAHRMLAFLDGRWEDAAGAWQAAAEADEAAGDLHDAVTNLRWLATARSALEDRTGAVRALERAVRLSTTGLQVASEIAARAELVRLTGAEDPDVAGHHLDAVERLVGGGEDWHGLVGTVELARASAHPGTAEEHLARAVEVFDRYDLPWHRAEAQLQAGQAGAARETYRRIGAGERWTGR